MKYPSSSKCSTNTTFSPNAERTNNKSLTTKVTCTVLTTRGTCLGTLIQNCSINTSLSLHWRWMMNGFYWWTAWLYNKTLSWEDYCCAPLVSQNLHLWQNLTSISNVIEFLTTHLETPCTIRLLCRDSFYFIKSCSEGMRWNPLRSALDIRMDEVRNAQNTLLTQKVHELVSMGLQRKKKIQVYIYTD